MDFSAILLYFFRVDEIIFLTPSRLYPSPEKILDEGLNFHVSFSLADFRRNVQDPSSVFLR